MTGNEFVWRKSSYSADNGECVEVGWRKSSYSAENGACVEAALLDGRFAVRDSKAPDAGTMSVGRSGMAALLSSVKATGRAIRRH